MSQSCSHTRSPWPFQRSRCWSLHRRVGTVPRGTRARHPPRRRSPLRLELGASGTLADGGAHNGRDRDRRVARAFGVDDSNCQPGVPPHPALRQVSSVPVRLGITMAFDPGTGPQRMPVRPALVAAVVGVAGVVGTLSINAAIDDALAHPELGGQVPTSSSRQPRSTRLSTSIPNGSPASRRPPRRRDGRVRSIRVVGRRYRHAGARHSPDR